MHYAFLISILLAFCGRDVTPVTTKPVPSTAPVPGIWISAAELTERPTRGVAWENLLTMTRRDCGTPDLANQEQDNGRCIFAKALVAARTGQADAMDAVVTAIRSIVNSRPYTGRALALGRELAPYVVAADLVDLKRLNPELDGQFRTKIRSLLTAPTRDGPRDLVQCHELRPNNWGTHCGASRAAVAAYLGDTQELARVAQVFKGWLGDRSSYAGFKYGDLTWQCDTGKPVGINRLGCRRGAHSLDGVLPDDQRRAGPFSWPPPRENYVYEALQGALVQAVILRRAGYDAFSWEDQALLRAFKWLHMQAKYPPQGDDVWMIHLINYFYEAHLPASSDHSPGKALGWTSWTHAR